MIALSQVPWSLRAYVLLIVIGVILTIIQAHNAVIGVILFVGIVSVWLKVLLDGNRLVWLATLTVSAVGVTAEIVLDRFSYLGLVGGIVGLVLLLLPPSRGYFQTAVR